jgi:hypothetical protein
MELINFAALMNATWTECDPAASERREEPAQPADPEQTNPTCSQMPETPAPRRGPKERASS